MSTLFSVPCLLFPVPSGACGLWPQGRTLKSAGDRRPSGMADLGRSDAMPRTFKNLYPRIYDLENLWLAWRRAAAAASAGGRAWPPSRSTWRQNYSGCTKNSATRRPARPLPPLHDLSAQGPAHLAAPFHDRVVHHALMQVTWPSSSARMIDDSYACRVGKGTHRAMDRCPTLLAALSLRVAVRRGSNSSPAVNHAILRGQLARHLACPATAPGWSTASWPSGGRGAGRAL